MPTRILLAEDDKELVEVMSSLLESEGFRVTAVYDGLEALWAVDEQPPDVIILDLALPGLSGFELCRKIRQRREYARIPIIVLSGKTDETDVVLALELGADDYLTKPVGKRELVARIKAILRRMELLRSESVLQAGEIECNVDRRTVTVAGRPVHLVNKEFELLRALIEAKGRVLTRDVLLDRVWGYEKPRELGTRTVDVHIGRLRQKLGQAGIHILTVPNVGYRLNVLVLTRDNAHDKP